MNPDIHLPLKGTESQHISTHSPAGGDCIKGVHEFGQQAEEQFRAVIGRDMLGGLRGLW